MISEFEAINTELSNGERLLWSAQPRQGIVFRPIDWFLIPFFLLWMSPAVGMLFVGEENVQNNTTLPFLVIPLIFVFVGLYMLVGRFLIDAKRRKRTFYGLTDKRAIIASQNKIKSVPITDGTELELKRHKQNFSTIQIGATPGFDFFSMSGTMSFWNGASQSNCFEWVHNGEEVYRHAKSIRGY